MAQLSCNERKGPVKIVFTKLTDVKIYISEKFKDPNAENASWIYKDPTKCIVLKPADQKSLTKAKKVQANSIEQLFFKFDWDSSGRVQELQVKFKITFPVED